MALLLILAIAGMLHGPAPADARPARAAAASHPKISFRSEFLLNEHYHKHGREFGSVSIGEYLRLAQALRDRPAGGSVIEIARADGVITRFDRGSGAFLAFNRDLTIRTFFRPREGETYFRRQALRRGRD